MVLGGTSLVTTLPAPTMAFSPIVTLARMVDPDPIDAPFFTKVGSTFQSAVGEPMKPQPDGLVVGYLDGSARFVRWDRLTPNNHEGDYIVYYDRET